MLSSPLVIPQNLHLVNQEDKSREIHFSRFPPTATSSATMGAAHMTLSCATSVSLPQNEEKKVTLSEDLNSDTRVKKDVQDKGERGEEQGSKDIGKKVTKKPLVTQLLPHQLLGVKKKLLMRCIHKLNLKDSI